MTENTNRFPIRVRSHILKLLGDQLVGHDRLAIFELVKNSYDADATKVDVLLDLKAGRIIVRDDGHGMSPDVVQNKWLDIGTDFKRGVNKARSPIYNRLPLGEKGVGRLAVQKLGSTLRMVTKSSNHPEVTLEVLWDDLIGSSDYVDGELLVNVTTNQTPTVFHDNETGTLIEISGLVRKEWQRKDLRDLKRLVVSLESPFASVDSFNVELSVPGREDEINDVPDLKELLNRSIWTFDFDITEDGFSWSYLFTPPKLKGLEGNTLSSDGPDQLERCDLGRIEAKSRAKSSNDVPLFIDLKQELQDIGPIRGRFHVFYQRDEILRLIGDPKQTKAWLKEQAGVRVFRDGIRVYNYGEPEDDWLGLNARRINRPTGKLGINQVVAAVELRLDESPGLREKTNREGFDSNEAFDRFKNIVLSAVEHFEKIHDADRQNIDKALKGDDNQVGPTVKLTSAISGLKDYCKTNKEAAEVLNPYVKAIEKEVEQVRSVMLSSGMAGMGLALVFHEIDRSIRTLTSLAEKEISIERIREGLSDLRKMLDSISALLKQGKSRKLSIREVIKQALELNETRFKFHGVTISSPVLNNESPDFLVTAPKHLLLSAINNIIDNAIYWAEYRHQRDGNQSQKPAILIVTHWDEKQGGVLSIVDNGPGLEINASDALQPFVSKRTGGMGLGLYYCQIVMENVGGEISVGSANDARDYHEIPSAYDGAAVTLLFNNKGEE